MSKAFQGLPNPSVSLPSSLPVPRFPWKRARGEGEGGVGMGWEKERKGEGMKEGKEGKGKGRRGMEKRGEREK